MRAIILGSGAGGGFPQWNCACANCAAVRQGRPGFLPRTQDSVAVRGDRGWVLINCSPDVLVQIQRTPALWPQAPRHTPIAAIVITNGDLDHVLGLFSLRESQPLAVYATPTVWRGLEQSVFVKTLRRFEGQLAAHMLPLDEPVAIEGLDVTALPLAGKRPVHLPGEPAPDDNVGLSIAHRGKRLVYAAACARVPRVEGDVVLFDGTFFREDELVRAGLGSARAADMAHVPIETSLEAVTAPRRIYTHINNSNPILDPESEERRAVIRAGWEIAFDGMELDV